MTLQNGGVTVASGGTLMGNFTAGGTTAIQSGGTLSVGNSPGTGNFSTLTLAGTNVMEFNTNASRSAAGTDFDTINISTGLSYGGGMNLVFAGLISNNAVAFDLFNFGVVTPTGNFASVNIFSGATLIGSLTRTAAIWNGALNLGYGSGSQDFSFSQTTGNLIVIITEPSTWALLVLGLIAVITSRRRRRTV